ncbi:C2 domain-containing protein 5-like isoform X2 [Liolophura sinensis]|uniref:C2 domain-containing protein 5-like isoform X2 n=1 Tax=Liolophura sinensis TaxID=3198878 RepID=UPI00315812D9
MPGRLKVRVVAGRDLPVMDRASELTDAFVEVRFCNTIFKTDVYRKSLNPQWNSEWFRFEVEDEELQDEPLQLRVLDYDTYSAHDAIGKVYIDLNPLLTKDEAPGMINGWFPIYDTMQGIRGELCVMVKVDLFSDFNRFRQSSCGVQFFSTAAVPFGYKLQHTLGFVEELVVNDDPEYQWIDRIRTPRASNEARQRLFSKLSGELQRKIGLKVLEMCGNAVIGYLQCYDLEGESGIVVRGIGTAVNIARIGMMSSPLGLSPLRDSPLPEATVANSSPPHNPQPASGSAQGTQPQPFHQQSSVKMSTSPGRVGMPMQRRSSDSDISTPPKGGSAGGSSGGSGGAARAANFKPQVQQQTIEMLEYPFFTMKSFPPGFIVHLGGVVSARSVKLLDRIHNPDEPETRDAWWTELRTEIRSHTRAMGCHAVLGYSEQTSICDEIIVLSAMGTAAKVNLKMDGELCTSRTPCSLNVSLDRSQYENTKEKDKEKRLYVDINLANQACQPCVTEDGYPCYNCSLCHVPYKPSTAPFPVNLTMCAICRKKKVPDVLFNTINPPPELQVMGKGCLIQARICRDKKDAKGEANAREISDILPFMEYEVHNQLMSKLKLRGMNGLFGLRVQVTIGEARLVALASATAVFIAPLPSPHIPKVTSQAKGTNEEDISDVAELQKRLVHTIQKNKERFEIQNTDYFCQRSPSSTLTDDSDEEQSDLELSFGSKDAFVLEVDDIQDEAVCAMLNDVAPPEGFELCNTTVLPGVPNFISNLQMFTQLWRGQFASKHSLEFSQLFERLMRRICYKLRKTIPCCLSELDFDVKIPDEETIQILVTGMCVGLGEPQLHPYHPNLQDASATNKLLLKSMGNSGAAVGTEVDDMMFQMEEVSDPSVQKPSVISAPPKFQYHTAPIQPKREIDLTPLSYIPGGKVDRYLGNYNFFFIRESTSVRELGGLNGFLQAFVAEVLSIVRANVASVAGNALVSYRMNVFVLMDNPHKNQAQCLVNVSGDVVSVLFDSDVQLATIPEFVRRESYSPVTPDTSSTRLQTRRHPSDSLSIVSSDSGTT